MPAQVHKKLIQAQEFTNNSTGPPDSNLSKLQSQDGLEIGEIRVDHTGAATLLFKKELDEGKRWSLSMHGSEGHGFAKTHGVVTENTKKGSLKL